MKAAVLPDDPIAALNARARAKGWTFVCGPGEDFDAPNLNAVCALWWSLAAPGKLPARAAFTARALKDFLPDLVIADILRPGTRIRFRYVGMNAVRYLGEMTGAFMDEYLPPSANERTAACYQAIIEARCPLRVVTRFSMDPIKYLSAEFFGAPLATDGVTPDMVMTITDFRRPARP